MARWSLLVRCVREVERHQALHDVNTLHFDAALISLGRLGASALKWAILYTQPFSMPLRWTGELSRVSDEAIAAAKEYSTFEVCFQGFHKEHYSAELIGADRIRFLVPGTERDRQVSAYQKGNRPTAGTKTVQRPAPAPQNALAKDAFEAALRRCRPAGALGFACDDLVWCALLPDYRERVSGIARRPDTISLEPYWLDEFNASYAASIAVAAANDLLCYQGGRISGTDPLESSVVVRRIPEWRFLRSRCRDLTAARVYAHDNARGCTDARSCCWPGRPSSVHGDMRRDDGHGWYGRHARWSLAPDGRDVVP